VNELKVIEKFLMECIKTIVIPKKDIPETI
jgi:hypothetical protein